MFRTAIFKKIKLTNRPLLTVDIKQQFYRQYPISPNSDVTGALCNVAKALKNIYINQMKAPMEMRDSSGDSTTQSLFCVEDSLSAKDVKVSVDNVGHVNFPITEDVIKKLIDISEKAQFGKGQKKVLDISYRDTQMIPADKLKVDIDQKVLENFLEHIGQELHIEDGSKLEIHLYNMLIYGPGQFFKKHQDSLKVPNMIASLIMVLPSPHNGGDLIIQHQNLKHRFFGSRNPDIIKCVAFYPDCFHELEKVEEGYRVALTYNVEIKPSSNTDPMLVDEKLKDAVKNYFEKSKSDKLVYFLDHEYTERSLKWNVLKGSDQIYGNALFAVGKNDNYCPCLALAKYHEVTDYEYHHYGPISSNTELYFFVDESNIGAHGKKVSVSKYEACFTTHIRDKFQPYKTNVKERYYGNENAELEDWYHRSAVVLWINKWAFRKEYVEELHLLTKQPDMQTTLLKKIRENSEMYFSSPFWHDESVTEMALDIMIYLNDKEIISKILQKLEPSEVLDVRKSEMVSWIAMNCYLETWAKVIEGWESTYNSKHLFKCLLPFLSNYMKIEEKNLGVLEYLLDETAKHFMNLEKNKNYDGDFKEEDNAEEEDEEYEPNYRTWNRSSYEWNGTHHADAKEVCSLWKVCDQMGNRVIEEKIFNHIISDTDTYTASFLADLLIEMDQVARSPGNNYTDFKKHALKKIYAELENLKTFPNNCYLSIKLYCGCKVCRQVEEFLTSPTSMQVTDVLGDESNIHIYEALNEMMVWLWPIRHETIGSLCSYKLTITKLPKLLEDRENYMKKLMRATKADCSAYSGET